MVPWQRDKAPICLVLLDLPPHPVQITSHPYLLPNIHYKSIVMELFPFQKTTNFIQNQLALMKIPGLKHIKNQAPVHKNKD